MQTNNFREPVEYIIKRHEKKKNTKVIVIDDADKAKIDLPEYPCRLVRDETKKVVKCLYMEGTELEWSEEFIRNSNGEIYKIKTVYPDKSTKTIELIKNTADKVELIDYV